MKYWRWSYREGKCEGRGGVTYEVLLYGSCNGWLWEESARKACLGRDVMCFWLVRIATVRSFASPRPLVAHTYTSVVQASPTL